jgi:hypothetical protein
MYCNAEYHRGAQYYKTVQVRNVCNKLEFWALASISRVVLCLQVKEEPTRGKHL